MQKLIKWYCDLVLGKPEIGSNAHLKEWLLSGKTIEEYIEKYC